MTILPPATGDAPLSRIPDTDDEQVDWSAVEAQGVDYRERRDRQTADTTRPGGSR